MDLLSPTSSPPNSTTSSPPSPSTTSSPPSPSTSASPPSPSTTSSPPSPSTSASPPSTSTTSSPPPPSTSASPPSPSTTSSPPSNSSAPPPQSSPASPPPSLPLSPPPSSPPPSPPSSPPPPPPKSPPPSSTPASPPPSPPTSPPTSTPPTPPPPLPPTSVPPSPPFSPPPPPDLAPPPPSNNSPPPQSGPDTPPPQSISPPPPQNISPPPAHAPPPANVITPPSSNPPPPQSGKSPPPPTVLHPPPPPHSQSASPPSDSSPRSPLSPDSPPPPPSIPSSSPPPPPIPSSSPPPISPVSPTNSSSESPTFSPLSSVTPEKPTAKAATGTNVTVTGNGGLSPGPSVAIAVVVGFLILSLVVMAVWFLKRRKRRNESKTIPYTLPTLYTSSHNSDSSLLRSHSPVPLMGSRSVNDFMYSSAEAGGMSNSRGFTYEDLVLATNSFSAKNILGEGGFGCVFKGTLPDGREIAVKQLKIGGGQGEREFRAEVDIISRIHHRHLVSLVGYCISEYQRLLVYDYVPNNTLHYHLHGNSPLPLLWATRARIAAGAARGIAYLHEDCHPRIIHRDIKSSNILLDINFEAQVADFGLAKLTLDTHTHVSTRVMGTFGYMAPEYATSGKLTDKSDVFSFGVVLLELITGRKPVDDSQPLGDESLVEWARPLLAQALDNENFEELVDARLEKNYVPGEMFRMIEAAAACVRHSAIKRPRMSQVVRALDSLDEMSDLANGVKPGQSGVFDSAQHSAQIRMFQRMAFGSQDLSTYYFDQDRSRSQSSWRSREDDELSSSTPFNRSRQLNN